jgi:hypothetical protein
MASEASSDTRASGETDGDDSFNKGHKASLGGDAVKCGLQPPNCAPLLSWSQLKLEESLGNGGRGEVHRAHLRNHRVAVRRVLASSNEASNIDAIQTELSVLVQMKHPNLLQVLGMAMDPSPPGGAAAHVFVNELCIFSLEEAVIGDKLGTYAGPRTSAAAVQQLAHLLLLTRADTAQWQVLLARGASSPCE